MVSDGRGLSLDVLPSGIMSWYIGIGLTASTARWLLGHYPDLTLKEARVERDELARKWPRASLPPWKRS